jgi:hypothetical protein
MAVAWSQDQNNFAADKVFPICPVNKESDLYAIYQKGTLYRANQMRPRPLGGRPPQAGYEITEGSYRCVEWALEHLIDDRVRANADQPLDPDLAGMRFLQTQALIQRETLWTSAYWLTGVWGTDWTGVSTGPSGQQFLQWDQSGSDPIQFIRARRNEVRSKTGYVPNVIAFGALAYEAFINHPDVVDRIKYTQAATGATLGNAVRALLDIDKVVIPAGVSNSAAEGQADSISYIANQTSCLLAYANPAPSITEPSAGYTFAYTGLIPGVTNAFGGVIMRGREELAHTDVLQIRASYTQNIVAADLGEFFQTVVSSNYGISTF